VDGLLVGMRDPHWGVRGASAAALAGSDDPRAAMALVSGLRDPVHQVRLESAWSLDRIEARR
jgi:HEAT repeat protein